MRKQKSLKVELTCNKNNANGSTATATIDTDWVDDYWMNYSSSCLSVYQLARAATTTTGIKSNELRVNELNKVTLIANIIPHRSSMPSGGVIKYFVGVACVCDNSEVVGVMSV